MSHILLNFNLLWPKQWDFMMSLLSISGQTTKDTIYLIRSGSKPLFISYNLVYQLIMYRTINEKVLSNL